MKVAGSDWNTQDAAAMRQEFFKKLDQDGNGKISKDELKTS